MSRQFSGHTVGELSAELQRENVVRALIDGIAPEVSTTGKVCPNCAETVKALAQVCRYCGHQFDS